MMKNWMMGALFGATLLAANAAMAQAVVGKLAPAFTATDATGKPVALSDFKGKFVVLEWTNPECPFVGKHYNSGAQKPDSGASLNGRHGTELLC
ncbi:redoxin domain-containing protein [Cupriavidus alkaliphilus]|uniref:redoxin domain-containing protein n=1 Tax=Cupriavidus alkaliphilus TaxID=942866 RepID=UPI00339D6CEE